MVSYRVPKRSAHFDHCGSSTSRCRPLLRTCGGAISREPRAAVMKLSWATAALPQARANRRCERSVSKTWHRLLYREISARIKESPENTGMGGRCKTTVALIFASPMYSAYSPVSLWGCSRILSIPPPIFLGARCLAKLQKCFRGLYSPSFKSYFPRYGGVWSPP